MQASAQYAAGTQRSVVGQVDRRASNHREDVGSDSAHAGVKRRCCGLVEVEGATGAGRAGERGLDHDKIDATRSNRARVGDAVAI